MSLLRGTGYRAATKSTSRLIQLVQQGSPPLSLASSGTAWKYLGLLIGRCGDA